MTSFFSRLRRQEDLLLGLVTLLWACLVLLLDCMGSRFALFPLFLGLVLLSLQDIREGLLPNRLQLPLALYGLLLAALQAGGLPLCALASSLSGALFLLLLRWLTRGGLGLGDVKLTALLGLYLGSAGLVLALLLAFLLGAVIGGFLLLTSRKSRGETIAFGPFLALGAVLALLLGDTLIPWYLEVL